MEYVRKLAEKERAVVAEEERRQAEADERLARELAEREKGGAESAKSAAAVATKDSAPTTSSILTSYPEGDAATTGGGEEIGRIGPEDAGGMGGRRAARTGKKGKTRRQASPEAAQCHPAGGS